MNKKEILYKVVTFINREELDFLDKVIKDLYFATGKKVPRAQMLKEMIEICQKEANFKNELIQDLNKQGGQDA